MTDNVLSTILDVVAKYTGKTSATFKSIKKELTTFATENHLDAVALLHREELVFCGKNSVLGIIQRHLDPKKNPYNYICNDLGEAFRTEKSELDANFQFESLSAREKAIFMAGVEQGRSLEKEGFKPLAWRFVENHPVHGYLYSLWNEYFEIRRPFPQAN